MTCPARGLRGWGRPLREGSPATFRGPPSGGIYPSQITAVHPELSPRCAQWRGICRPKTSGNPIFTICPMRRATSSTHSVIITKSFCPRIAFACCASCTLMAPSSPTLELHGREHSNCTAWAQRLGDPKLRSPGNEAFGLFVRRMGSVSNAHRTIVAEYAECWLSHLRRGSGEWPPESAGRGGGAVFCRQHWKWQKLGWPGAGPIKTKNPHTHVVKPSS